MDFKKILNLFKENIFKKKYKDIFTIQNLKNKIFIFLKKRWKLKIVSLLISVAIFFYLQLRNIDKVVLTLPLSIEKKSSQIILNEIPKTVTVHLTGIERKIDSINVNQLKGSLNLTEKSNGDIKVSPKVINLQQDIKITKMTPESVIVKVSSISKKWVEIVPKINGIPNRKYNYVDYSIKPKMVLVSGPKEIIKETSQITTEPISINGISYNQKYNVDVSKTIHPKLSLSKDDDYEVVIYVAAKEKEIKLFEEQFPINFINYPKDKNIVEDLPMIKNVVLSLREKINLEEVKRDIYFYVDLEEEKESYKIQFKKISNAKIVDYSPRKIKITYEEE